MFKLLGLILALGMGGLILQNLHDIRRYLYIRSM